MHCGGCDNMPFWRWLKETQMYPTSITCNDFDGEFQTNFQPYSVIGCSGEYLCTLGFIKSPKQTLGDLLFLLRFLLLLFLFSFLSVHHELFHGRSQELQDRIS